MGGWLALLLVRALRRRAETPVASVAGMVLIAPAVDFTEELMWRRFTPAIKQELEEIGVWERPSEYSPEPYVITRALIEEGRSHLLLGGMIETGCPVQILKVSKIRTCPGNTPSSLCRGWQATTWSSHWSRTATTGCRVRRTSSD